MKKIVSVLAVAATLLSLLAAVPAHTADGKLPFTDVPEKAWYYKEVSAAFDAGLMNGRSETVFAPKENVTRAEIAAILARIDGADLSDTAKYAASFPDVKAGAWYVKYLGWAAEQGILKGYTDGSVKPNAPVTRAELAVMMDRYVATRGVLLPPSPKVGSFADAGSFKKWYAPSAEVLRVAGIFAGDSAGKFNPSSNATRAEVAALAVRLSGSVEIAEDTVVVASREKKTEIAIITDPGNAADGNSLTGIFLEKLRKMPRVLDDTQARKPVEFVLAGADRPAAAGITEGLGPLGFRIRVTVDEEGITVAVGYLRSYVLEYAAVYIFDTYYSEGELRMPKDLDFTGSYPYTYQGRDLPIVESDVYSLRDPFVVAEDGVYYMYGTGWKMYKNTSGDLRGPWEGPVDVVETPEDCKGDKWAPEVHKYGDRFYMFTTYRSKTTGHRGCAIFVSDTPEGPFTLHSDGHVTPADWDSIDGTLYIDPEGKPWMVFVHEWTSTDDSIGRMAAARLSDDLKEFITEPVELFRADDPVWSEGQITDGPFMYRCADGQLLMIWSNSDRFGYCVGVARSASGEVTGPWTQDEVPLYSLGHSGLYNGGHGMIFTSFEGDTYVSMHNNNGTTDTTGSKPFFLRIREEGGTLVWDFRDE